MEIIVTGSRIQTNRKFIYDKLDYLHWMDWNVDWIERLIQGGARGVDDISKDWALANDVECVTVNAEWDKYGKAAGHKRNGKMLDMFPFATVAGFPKGDAKGTWNCLNQAKVRQMNILIFRDC